MRTVAIAAAMLAATCLASPALAEVQVIHAGHLIRDADGSFEGPSTITVEDGRIVAITGGL